MTGSAQPASLLTPIWVTAENMNSTVINDKFISPKALCKSVGNAKCTSAGITP